MSLFRYIFLTCSVSLGVVVFMMILITCTSIYSKNCFKVSLLFCVLICSLSLSVYLQLSPEQEEITAPSLDTNNATTVPDQAAYSDLSEAGLFTLYVQVNISSSTCTYSLLCSKSISVQVLVLIYTVIPLPLYGTLIVGLLYTCLLEILAGCTIYTSRWVECSGNILKVDM